MCEPDRTPSNVPEPETFVERLGLKWPIAGWVLFSGWFLGMWLISFPFAALAFVLWLVWWIADVVYVQPAPWQIVVGAAMVAIGILPRGATLIVAAWVIYWMRVREP